MKIFLPILLITTLVACKSEDPIQVYKGEQLIRSVIAAESKKAIQSAFKQKERVHLKKAPSFDYKIALDEEGAAQWLYSTEGYIAPVGNPSEVYVVRIDSNSIIAK